MCAVRLEDRITDADLWNRFGIDCVGDIVRRTDYVGLRLVHKPEAMSG